MIRTSPVRPIRCDLWIVEQMRYPTNRPKDTASYRGALSHLKIIIDQKELQLVTWSLKRKRLVPWPTFGQRMMIKSSIYIRAPWPLYMVNRIKRKKKFDVWDVSWWFPRNRVGRAMSSWCLLFCFLFSRFRQLHRWQTRTDGRRRQATKEHSYDHNIILIDS